LSLSGTLPRFLGCPAPSPSHDTNWAILAPYKPRVK
jgi:hypothetical protein